MEAAEGESRSFKPQFVNVILHGAYALILDDDCIWAYTPACFGHMYNAGTHEFRKNTDLRQGVNYALFGVNAAGSRTINPDGTKSPVLSLSSLHIQRKDIDPYDKRYTRIRLPYPQKRDIQRPELMCGGRHAFLGEVYSGKKAGAMLNSTMEMCASVQILVYELDGGHAWLEPSDGSSRIYATEVSSCDSSTLNFHIFCTKSPDIMMPLKAMGAMTDEGHMRRAFAAIVDLVGCLELTMNFPDGFHPAVPASESVPKGIDPDKDLEPEDPKWRGPHIHWGHVNCGSGQLIFTP